MGLLLRLAGPLGLALVLSLSVALSVHAAGPVEAHLALTQAGISIGDQTALRLSVVHPHDTQLQLPDLFGRLGNIEVLSVKRLPDTVLPDGTRTTEVEYTITAFAVGSFPVPPITIPYVDGAGDRGSVTTANQLTLQVESVLATQTDKTLQDIQGPVAIPRDPVTLVRPAAAAALGLAALAVALILVRRWPRRAAAPLPALLLSPEETARRELARIAELRLAEQGAYREHYGGISRCVRTYLDAHFLVAAMASTSSELRDKMEQHGLDRWQARVISGLLAECDSVRWAHYQPDPERARRALTMAYEIVELVSNARAQASMNGHDVADVLASTVRTTTTSGRR